MSGCFASRSNDQTAPTNPSAPLVKLLAQRATKVPPVEKTLETQVSSGGTNSSQGQRQLIAVAHALDYRATSSIDFATNSKIQAAIREKFGGTLPLTSDS